jgi:hypothetical protein
MRVGGGLYNTVQHREAARAQVGARHRERCVAISNAVTWVCANLGARPWALCSARTTGLMKVAVSPSWSKRCLRQVRGGFDGVGDLFSQPGLDTVAGQESMSIQAKRLCPRPIGDSLRLRLLLAKGQGTGRVACAPVPPDVVACHWLIGGDGCSQNQKQGAIASGLIWE